MGHQLSIRIMAHPARETWAKELASELDCPIIWDQEGSAWDTGRRALLSGEGSHVAVIQDDAILSEGLPEVLRAMVEHSSNHPICLYSQRTSRMTAVERIRDNQPWFLAPGPHYGPGVVIPTEHVPELVKFGDRYRHTSYDQRLWHFYQGEQVECLYSYPSLIDHRLGPSLMHKRNRDRPAYNFGSGLGLDWSIPPLRADNHSLYPRMTMTKDGRAKQVRYGTGAWRQAVRNGFVEEQPPGTRI